MNRLGETLSSSSTDDLPKLPGARLLPLTARPGQVKGRAARVE
jgi:hypothetical protein